MSDDVESAFTTSLLADQRSRWDRGERVPVEEFLSKQPSLRENTEVLLDLIYAEVVLRREAGEEPTPDEYIARFPNLADPIRTQFEVDAAIGMGMTRPTNAFNDRTPPPPPTGYEIIEEVGRGGMGVVYKARHIKLDRVVALKMIRSGEFAEPGERSRFESEARAIAQLSHPNIIQIYEVGEASGRPFLALEYVPGKSLADMVSKSPLGPRPAAALAATLARAVQHAHEAGVLHRDLKPANILLEAVDGSAKSKPKITDFGLAKQMGSDGLTRTGDFVGTPNFTSPEQATGRSDIAAPADVYSLGAILYQMLTGRPPFVGATPLETIDLVRFSEVVPPSRLRPNLPRDLETIALKCLRKEPEKRYASAMALASDLERFLHGKPIEARPVGPIKRAAKWCKRRPAIAALTGSILMLALVSLITMTILWQRAVAARDDQGQARNDERLQREQAQARNAALLIANARYAWLIDDLDAARTALAECPEEYRTSEWAMLNRSCHAGRQLVAPTNIPLDAITTSFDGERIAAGTAQSHVHVWKSATGKEIHDFYLPNQSTQTLAFAKDGRLFGTANMTALDPDGNRRYMGVLTLMEPDVGNAKVVWTIPERPSRFVVSPDGVHVASYAEKARTATVQDATTGNVLHRIESPVGYLMRAVYSTDGRYLVTAALPSELIAWDAETGKRHHAFRCPENFFGVNAIAISPDAELAVVSGNNNARSIDLYLLHTTREPRRIDTQLPLIGGFCFSPDGRWVAAHDSSDSVIRVWEAMTGREEVTFRGIPSVVRSITFTPDSRYVVAGYRDGRVVLWDLLLPDHATR